MRPLTVITGIMLGSSLSIAFSLAAVLLVFAILGDEHPRLSREFGPLLASLSIFTTMTVISAASFYALLRNHAWRWFGQCLMWVGFVLAGAYYWP